MRMHGIGRAYGPTGGYSANSKKAGSDSYAKSAAKQTDRMAGGANKVYQVYLQTDDMLYSGGNGTGLSFYIKYAEESTEEDPVVVAKGVDEYGEELCNNCRNAGAGSAYGSRKTKRIYFTSHGNRKYGSA